MVAGRKVTPQDEASTERLMRYWAEGAGAAKIGWGTDGDFDRCRAELGKYVGPGVLDGLCSNLHQRATGFRPGHAPGEGKLPASNLQAGQGFPFPAGSAIIRPEG